MRNHHRRRDRHRSLGFQGRQARWEPARLRGGPPSAAVSDRTTPSEGRAIVRGWWACVVAAAVLASPVVGVIGPTIAVVGGFWMTHWHAQRSRR